MIQKSFLLIAYRYLFTKQKDSTIRFMLKICIAGVSIATFSLALVISIMQGFETATYNKMQTIYPDLILDANGEEINFELLKPILKEKQYHISHISEQQIEQALFHSESLNTKPSMICLRSVNPENEDLVSSIGTKIILPTKTKELKNILKKNTIIIGQKLAKTHHITIGDSAIILYSHDQPESLEISFSQVQVTIGACFQTGIDEFDSSSIFISKDCFCEMFPDSGITQVHMKMNNISFENETISALKKRLHINIYSWKDLYAPLVSALKLEKYAMFFILLLIVFVACINIVSLIFMYVAQKKKDIALFLCFKMAQNNIRFIFIIMSLFIATCGASCGLSMAFIVGKIIQKYPFIKLPDDIYDSSYLPIKLDLFIFFIIFITTLIISFFAALIATKDIAKIKIVQTLKYE